MEAEIRGLQENSINMLLLGPILGSCLGQTGAMVWRKWGIRVERKTGQFHVI